MRCRLSHKWVVAASASALLLLGCSTQNGHTNPATTSTKVGTAKPAKAESTVAGSTISCGEYTTPAQGAALTIATTSGSLKPALTGTEESYQSVSGGSITISKGSTTLAKLPLVQPNLGPAGLPGMLQGSPVGLDSLSDFEDGGTGLPAPVYNTDKLPKQYPLCIVASQSHPSTTYILLQVDSRNAHCCSVVDTWAVSQGGISAYSSVLMGNGPAYLTKLDRRVALIGADNRFAYMFDAYAGSLMPIRIYTPGPIQNHSPTSVAESPDTAGSGWTEVTKQFPAVDSQEAKSALKEYQRSLTKHNSGLGAIAAWAADERVLGRSSSAAAYINAQLQAGHLNYASPGMNLPSGTAFVASLKGFLIRTGYCNLG